MEGFEPKFGTPRGQGLNDPGDIIANEDESCHFAVALHCSPQSILSVLQTTPSGKRLSFALEPQGYKGENAQACKIIVFFRQDPVPASLSLLHPGSAT